MQNLELDQQAAATPTHQTSRMYCQWLQSTCASGLWYRLRMTPERPAMMTAYQCVMQSSEAMPVGVSHCLCHSQLLRYAYNAAVMSAQTLSWIRQVCALTNSRLAVAGQSVMESTDAKLHGATHFPHANFRHPDTRPQRMKLYAHTCMIAHGFCLSCAAASAPKYLSSTLGPLVSVKST